jgi:Uma2 family endonuclease
MLRQMKATLSLPQPSSYADYLAVEQVSAHRHEFLDGVIVAMSGGSHEHNAITNKLAALFVQRVTKGCRSYSPDQRFWIAARARARYADGSIICGNPESPAHDNQATTNPVVIVEVLSPSSAGDDDGDKRVDFQSLSSLRAYVLVAQDQRRVRVYRRTERGEWRHEAEVYGDTQSFDLPSLTGAVAVGEIYDDILDAQGRSLLR